MTEGRRGIIPASHRSPPPQGLGATGSVLSPSLGRRRFCTTLAAATAAMALPSPMRASPGIRARPVGDLQVMIWSDGSYDVPLSAFPGAVERGLGAPDDPVRLGGSSWSIRTPTRLILVDAGAGEHLRDLFPHTGLLRERYETGGLATEEVTDIILTHMHPDHIGGLMNRERSCFPNAMLHVATAEWDYWTASGLVDRVPPGQGIMAALVPHLAAGLDYEVLRHSGATDLGEGVRLVPTPGHTPGHLAVEVESRNEHVMLLGDAVVCGPLQFAHPDISYVLDVDVRRAMETRHALLERLAVDRIPFSATHLATMGLGTLGREPGGGYRYLPA